MREVWTVKPSTYAEVNRIARRMRAADVRELSVTGSTPKQALVRALRGSTLVWTAWLADRPVAMFGVAPISVAEGRGAAWMLGTDEVVKGARALLKMGPAFVAGMQQEFPLLENAVAADNRPALRLLKALGFDITPEVVIVGDVPMRRFSRGRKPCAIPQP